MTYFFFLCDNTDIKERDAISRQFLAARSHQCYLNSWFLSITKSWMRKMVFSNENLPGLVLCVFTCWEDDEKPASRFSKWREWFHGAVGLPAASLLRRWILSVCRSDQTHCDQSPAAVLSPRHRWCWWNQRWLRRSVERRREQVIMVCDKGLFLHRQTRSLFTDAGDLPLVFFNSKKSVSW